LPALIFLACSGAVHPTRRRTRTSWAWVWKRRGKGSEDMVLALRLLRMDRKGAGRRRKPSARKLTAKSVRRRRGATASVDGKSEKVAVPFGAYLLCKSCCPLALRGDRGEVKRMPAPGPLLSHPMTGGPGPASQRPGRWRKGGKGESEPPEPRDGLE
jgi:hypothetical protein